MTWNCSRGPAAWTATTRRFSSPVSSLISSLIFSHECAQTVKRTSTQMSLRITGQHVEQLNASVGVKISAKRWRRRRMLLWLSKTLEKSTRPFPHRSVAPSVSSLRLAPGFNYCSALAAFIISRRIFKTEDAS